MLQASQFSSLEGGVLQATASSSFRHAPMTGSCLRGCYVSARPAPDLPWRQVSGRCHLPVQELSVGGREPFGRRCAAGQQRAWPRSPGMVAVRAAMDQVVAPPLPAEQEAGPGERVRRKLPRNLNSGSKRPPSQQQPEAGSQAASSEVSSTAKSKVHSSAKASPEVARQLAALPPATAQPGAEKPSADSVALPPPAGEQSRSLPEGGGGRPGMAELIRGALDRGGGAAAPASWGVDAASLVPGEFVVHRLVGVAQFLHLKPAVLGGRVKAVPCVWLRFADGVGVFDAAKARQLLFRYKLPGELDKGKRPKLHKQADHEVWTRRMGRVRAALEVMVSKGMKLHLQRLQQKRPRYQKFPEGVAEFAARFPYEPTPDQLQAFLAVESDLTERDQPMDRLICGDVGFGKTEVALRAIFLSVLNGRQVMVLAPTTVLAKQHFKVIFARLAPYGQFNVQLFTRFQKESVKKEVEEAIQKGSLHVVVGTHCLLRDRVRFHNLGLVIVDEEHKFGVHQKEQMTAMRCVDVLTLSATPIPRTLSMALQGFRDASLITTPPPQRRPVITHLFEYSFQHACKAIEAELARDGQVYYCLPRIKDKDQELGIQEKQRMLEERFPDVSVAVAHGQQPTEELECAMEDFAEGRTQVLVCTSIIESGLDIPRANTIIIENVHYFGLAQLHQLRGRVGRAGEEAHAYLFHPPLGDLTAQGTERLEAVRRCSGLGKGFQLAESDMAIRGIGDIFGEKQSGEIITDIGSTDLYQQMLRECVERMRRQRIPEVAAGDVRLAFQEVDKHLPSEWCPSEAKRKRIVAEGERAAALSWEALLAFREQLRAALPPPPLPVTMWEMELCVRRCAADLGIFRVATRGRKDIVFLTDMNRQTFELIQGAVANEDVRGALRYEPGRIELPSIVVLPPHRLLVMAYTCLVEMRRNLPAFGREPRVDRGGGSDGQSSAPES